MQMQMQGGNLEVLLKKLLKKLGIARQILEAAPKRAEGLDPKVRQR